MNYIHNQDDFAVEPVRGLPAALPPGEFILWQGAPSWRAFARQVYRTRLIGLLILAGAITPATLALVNGTGVGTALGEGAVILAFGAAGIAILLLLAWLVQQTTIYTITNKRVMMRIGVALQKTFNIPFSAVEAASIGSIKGDAGNLSLNLKPDVSLAYLILWPHVRPWQWRHAEPTLRGIPNVESVSRLLTDAYTSHIAADDALALASEQSSISNSASRDEDAKQHKLRDQHYISKPMVMMAACAALFTVLVVGYAQLTGQAAQRANTGTPAFEQALLFVGDPNEDITVIDATSGEQLSFIPAGEDGILRGSLRGLAMTRTQAGVDGEAALVLQRFDEDGVYLFDPSTQRSIRLESFGPMHSGTTAELLSLAYAQ